MCSLPIHFTSRNSFKNLLEKGVNCTTTWPYDIGIGMCNSDEDCLPTLKCIERKCQLPHQQSNGDNSKCSVKPNGMNS